VGQPQMNAQEIIDTARTLVAGDKGLLVMDESNSTCNKRFAKLGIPQTAEARGRLSGVDCDYPRSR
jgi:fructose-bisphosphate aldolase class I